MVEIPNVRDVSYVIRDMSQLCGVVPMVKRTYVVVIFQPVIIIVAVEPSKHLGILLSVSAVQEGALVGAGIVEAAVLGWCSCDMAEGSCTSSNPTAARKMCSRGSSREKSTEGQDSNIPPPL